MIDWLSYAGAGVIAGFIAGLFGVGGGLIIVPILLVIFSWQALPADIALPVAIGTSLMTICVTSVSSIYAHHRHQNVQWPIVRLLAIGLVIGSLFGAVIATNLPVNWLKKVFVLFVFLVALRLWLPQAKTVSQRLLTLPALTSFCVLTGMISALVGIGGGTLVVPYLMMAGERAQRAIGTAAACGFPIAVSGVIGFILMGTQIHQIEGEGLIGFIHWQAFLGVISTSVLMAPLGVKVAQRLSSFWLQRLFSLLLLSIGLWMVFSHSY